MVEAPGVALVENQFMRSLYISLQITNSKKTLEEPLNRLYRECKSNCVNLKK